MTPDLIDQLQQSKIDWQITTESPYLFQHMFQGKLIKLRLNDFPDAPICTIMSDDAVCDLDSFPKSWTLPRHRRELGAD